MNRLLALSMLSLMAWGSFVRPGAAARAAPAPPAAAARSEPGNSPGDWVDRTPLLAASKRLPPAAEDCTAIVDTVANRLVLFGGKDDANQDLGELWTLDLERFAWAKPGV